MKNLDLERLTLGEVSTIESLAQMPITAIGDDDRPVGKMLAALVMVCKRRSGEPKFTFNDALDTPLIESHEILGIEDEDEDDAKDEAGANGAEGGATTVKADAEGPAPKAKSKS